LPSKRKSQHKKQLQMQKLQSPHNALINPTTGLRNDEIAYRIDPNEPSKVKSYVMPDGRVLKPGDKGTLQGLTSIVHPNLLVTSSKARVFRLTLASRLHEMLLLAEGMFGKRDRSYAFLGIEFTEENPHLHYEADKSVIMRLHVNALLEPMEAYAQMAHECIHMLSPNPTKPVTILEEGMAEVFAYIYMQDVWKVELPSKMPGSAYHEARELVGSTMGIDTFGIKRIREEEPTISLISKSLIWKHYPTLYEGVAARLARTLVRDGCADPDILAQYEGETQRAMAGD